MWGGYLELALAGTDFADKRNYFAISAEEASTIILLTAAIAWAAGDLAFIAALNFSKRSAAEAGAEAELLDAPPRYLREWRTRRDFTLRNLRETFFLLRVLRERVILFLLYIKINIIYRQLPTVVLCRF